MGELFESIKRGMIDAIAHSKGEKTEARLFISRMLRRLSVLRRCSIIMVVSINNSEDSIY
jgi:hypothetical protein